jgi:hypothetical protein
MTEEGNWPDLAEYYEHLEIHRIFQATGFEIDKTLTYPELVNSFLIQRSLTRGKPIVGATVHRHYDRLLRIWSNAKFLHIVRDPRDVAPSCVGMGWAGNVWSGVDRWIEAEELWEQVSSSIPSENKLEFSYSDLIENNQEILNQICEFVGVSYDEKMLTYPENTAYSLPDPKLVSQWRKKLSDREVQLIESKVGDLLERRGFQPSGLTPREPNFFEALLLKSRGASYLFRCRVEVFGLRLVLTEMLSRKLNLKALHRRQRLKMQAIQQTRIKKSLT